MLGFKGPPGGQTNSEHDLAEGRLPANVTERLKRVTAGNLAASSDLSVNEFLYLQRFGIRPLSLVMGSSVYKYVNPIGGYVDNIPSVPGTFQLHNFNRDYQSSHQLALERLTMEAQALKADAVVGMTLRKQETGSGAMEVMYLGTAVTFDDPTRTQKYGVLTSFLPAQDFCALLTGGYLPVRAVVSTSMLIYIPDYYEHMLLETGLSGFSQLLAGSYNSNQELGQLSQACAGIYQTLRRNLSAGWDVPGNTVMGVDVTFEPEEITVGIPGYNFFPGSMANEVEAVGSFLLTGTLTGTLVARVDTQRKSPPVLSVLWLNK